MKKFLVVLALVVSTGLSAKEEAVYEYNVYRYVQTWTLSDLMHFGKQEYFYPLVLRWLQEYVKNTQDALDKQTVKFLKAFSRAFSRAQSCRACPDRVTMENTLEIAKAIDDSTDSEEVSVTITENSCKFCDFLSQEPNGQKFLKLYTDNLQTLTHEDALVVWLMHATVYKNNLNSNLTQEFLKWIGTLTECRG